ncbi:MAG: hypothetical protein KDA88_14160 [Planctomycetaceae bacterium]|nr:hypothetical protein [Planctomycetaceae bacterium]MCB9951993.1 hypothetical protein [Planctomycetaceae bacterium]
MNRKPSLTAEKYATIDELVRLGSIAVNDAQNESRRLGVPNVYSINGRLYYETPTGELSTSDPFVDATVRCDESKTP